MLDSTFARSTQQIPTQRQPHAVVIGSGFGGLAAAVRLGAKGYRVTVLEKLDAPGGRAYVYRQDGFTFDAGPTIVTAPFLFEELWKLCGRKMSDDVTLVPVSPFYRIRFQDGSHFDYSGDAAAMRAEIARFSPEDTDGYDAYMKASEAIFKVGFEQLGDVPFSKWTDMARIAPDMIRLSSYRSVFGLVSKFFRDERLRVVFSFHPLLIGGNPFTASSIYCLIAFLERRWGVHFALGGTGRLVEGLVRLIEGQGGRLRCNEEVGEILVRNGAAWGVRLTSGETIGADVVVSNADSAWTYRHLLPSSARSRWTDKRIERARYSMSLFVWYFGTNCKYDDVPHHTILLGPRYKELLTDIFERKILADDFSLYLHRPTATDTSLAPEGCDAFYVLSPVPHLQSGTDWGVTAEKYRHAIARELGSTMLPDLENHIVSSHMLTPQDFQDRLSSFRGAAFGLEPILTQSAWFRPHNKSEDIANLYLVGAGTHPGAGLPGVLSSARVLDSLVPDAQSLSNLVTA
ncbi:MAG: phytoene desaturase [Bradyrhizobium sp.]